jgi:hypothetical protein
MAQLSKSPYTPTDPSINFQDHGWEAIDRSQKHLKELIEISDKIDPDDPNCDITNAILKFPVADGYAFYIVSKAKPLTLSLIPIGDSYQIMGAAIRGINKAFVLDHLRTKKRFESLFKKR